MFNSLTFVLFQGLQFKTEQGQHILKNPLIITSLIEKVSFDPFIFLYSPKNLGLCNSLQCSLG